MFVWLLGLVVHLSMLVDRAAPPTFEIFFNPPAPPSRERAPLLFFPYFFTFDIFAASGVREPSNHHSQSRYKIDSLIPILEHELNTSSPFNPIHITYFLTCIHMEFVKSLHTQANHYLNTHIKCLKKSTIRTQEHCQGCSSCKLAKTYIKHIIGASSSVMPILYMIRKYTFICMSFLPFRESL